MTTDHYILAGCVVIFLAAVAYAMWPKRSAAMVAIQGYAQPIRAEIQAVETSTKTTLRSAIAAVKEDGEDLAFSALAAQYAAKHATETQALLQGMFVPKDVTATPPASPS
jgi:hypothetical protein